MNFKLIADTSFKATHLVASFYENKRETFRIIPTKHLLIQSQYNHLKKV